jgi:hypothetical protein
MVMQAKRKFSMKDPQLEVLTQTDFKRGVITLIDESKLPDNALKIADNAMLFEDGSVGPRWGTQWFGSPIPNGAALDGGGFFSTATGNHMVAIGGGNIYRSLDDGNTWTLCTGATFTAGKKCTVTQYGNSIQAKSYLQIVNGVDSTVRYDGTTTLQLYTSLTTPTVTAITAAAGIAGLGYSNFYRISAVNSVGFTAGSPSSQGTVNVTKPRGQWNTTNSQTNYVAITWTAVPNTLRYDIFESNTLGNEVYIDSVNAAAADTSVVYNDYGSVPEEANIQAPVDNTTTGPLIGDVALIGSRLWGTNDPAHPYRVWWSGSGPYLGYFSTSYDGGYIDLQYGSQFRPRKVAEYEDGKGTPLTSVFNDSADGLGCIWQIQLTTATVQNLYSYTVPSAYRLPGSRGTPAPRSVVNVLNDYMYFNSQGIYNLGPRSQFLNLLSTEEATANIRPTIRQVNAQSAANSCAHYYLAKVFFSVPTGVGQVTNNVVLMYDTEYKAWMPTCFTYGVEQFFDYSDNQAVPQLHLLMWKPGDSQFSEISPAIQGDYGKPYPLQIVTGVKSVDKNRFNYIFTEEMQVELSKLQGQVNIELNGNTRNRGIANITTTSIKKAPAVTLNGGWSTTQWSTQQFSYYPKVTSVFSEPSTPGWKTILAELRAYQFSLTSNTLPCAFVLRVLQIQGTLTQAGQPRQERLP